MRAIVPLGEWSTSVGNPTKVEAAVSLGKVGLGIQRLSRVVGFTAVVRRNPQEWEAWNIGSTLSRPEVEAIRREDEATLRMGLAALRGRLGNQPAVNLSVRERMCLDLLGCGLRTKAIAQELGISVVTVELHLRNARTKLGAATRDQALMLYRAKTPS